MSYFTIKGDFNRVLLLDNIKSYNLKPYTEAQFLWYPKYISILEKLEVVLNEIENYPPILVVDYSHFNITNSKYIRSYKTNRIKWHPGLLSEIGMYILFLVHKEDDNIYLELLEVNNILDELVTDLNLLRDLKLKFLINE